MPTPVHLPQDLEEVLTRLAHKSGLSLDECVEGIMRWAIATQGVDRFFLSPTESALLASGGFMSGAFDTTALVATAQRRAQIVSTSLSLPQAAAMLGIEPSKLVEDLAHPNSPVYAIYYANEWRFPDFQFDDDRFVPKIGEVIKNLPHDLDLVAVDNWFRLPNVDLVVAGQPVTPLSWLKLGLDSAHLVSLVEDL